MIKRLLDKDPRKRLGAEHGAADIKEHPFFKGKVNWALIRNQKPPIKPSLSNSISSSLRDKDSDSSGDENENAGESARTDPFSSFETRTYFLFRLYSNGFCLQTREKKTDKGK